MIQWTVQDTVRWRWRPRRGTSTASQSPLDPPAGGKPNATETNPGPGRRQAPGPFLFPRRLLPATAEGWTFLALALLQLAPVWGVPRFLTTDGPAHSYTAWALHHHGDPAAPALNEHFEVHLRPVPNWTSQALLWLALPAVSPATAEKLVASAVVLLLAGGARFLLRAVAPERAWLALLALPFCFHKFVRTGFFNFSLGLGLYLVVLACAWRARRQPRPRDLGLLHALLLLLYFCHIVPHLAALAGIAALWLATPRARDGDRRWAALALLTPQLLLPAWFFLQAPHDVRAGSIPWSDSVRYLTSLQALPGSRWVPLGALTAVLFAALALATLAADRGWRGAAAARRPREVHAFALLAAAWAVAAIVAPEGAAGGGLLRQRLSLFPYLTLLPWLAPPLGRITRRALVVCLALLGLAGARETLLAQRRLQAPAAELLAALDAIAPHSRLLPVFFSGGEPAASLRHLPCQTAAARDLVNWGFYQGRRDSFPVRFRSGRGRGRLEAIEAEPAELTIGRHRGSIDYVLTWRLPAGSATEQRILRFYRPVRAAGDSALFVRRGRGQPPGQGAPPPVP